MSEPVEATEPEFAAFIAIDWADRQHAWSLQAAGSDRIERGTLKHTPEDLHAWAMQLAGRFAGRPVAVALEQAKGALIHALSCFSHLVLYPVHPSTSHKFRSAMFPSGTKDDIRDADMLLQFLLKHRDKLHPLQPDDELTRKLRTLVEKRRQLVDQRTAASNRLRSELKLYFPQVLDWFEELQLPIACAFLEHWPTLACVQSESPQNLRAFFFQHRSRSHGRIEQRIRDIAAGKPLTTDAAVIEPAAIFVRAMTGVISALNRSIQAMDQTIAGAAASHVDTAIFASFPGAGPQMAPRLLAAFGSQRNRFRSANDMQSYSGIAPVKKASGSQCWIHFRWACPKFLRQTFHEYAALSIQHCQWAREFYDRQRNKQKGHHAAVRSLAFKWIRILFRCWQSRQPYQEQRFLASRQRAPLPATLVRNGGIPEQNDFKSIRDLCMSIPLRA